MSELKADHVKVSGLFAEYGKARSTSEKKALVADICAELSVHAQIEEEIFWRPRRQGDRGCDRSDGRGSMLARELLKPAVREGRFGSRRKVAGLALQ